MDGSTDMPKPSDYKYIRAWGQYLGSYEYYIKSQQIGACEENAPLDAIYYSIENGWRTVKDIPEEAQAELNRFVK